MTSRERVVRTLNFQPVDRPPRDLWTLPGVRHNRQHEIDHVLALYPSDFISPGAQWGNSRRAGGISGEIGSWTDQWGTVRETRTAGVTGKVVEALLDDWAALDSYQPPWEMVDGADFSQFNRDCEDADEFIFLGSHVDPFQRMQLLRGSEKLFIDLAYGTREMYRLREMVHDFSLRAIRLCAETECDGVRFADDWGTQTSMLISPAMWRELFKPLYKEYCDILKSKGKYVFFHSDGFIEPIYPEMIEIGINAVNSQVFCMDMEKLGRDYAGKIVFWGEIDRQKVLPFGTTDDVRAAVQKAARNLRYNNSGIIAQCEWGVNDPMENILAVFDEWEKV